MGFAAPLVAQAEARPRKATVEPVSGVLESCIVVLQWIIYAVSVA